MTNYHFNTKDNHLENFGCGEDTILNPNGKNIVQVIANTLIENPHKFERYNRLVRQVFSNIEYISIKRIERGFFVVKWSPNDENDWLSVDEYDSGLGQVLATILVLMTANEKAQITIEDRDRVIDSNVIQRLRNLIKDYVDPINGELDHQITFIRLPSWAVWIGSKLYDLRRADRSEEDGLIGDLGAINCRVRSDPNNGYVTLHKNNVRFREDMESRIKWKLWEEFSSQDGK